MKGLIGAQPCNVLRRCYAIVDRAILCVDDVGGNRVVCHPLAYFHSRKRPRVPVAGLAGFYVKREIALLPGT